MGDRAWMLTVVFGVFLACGTGGAGGPIGKGTTITLTNRRPSANVSIPPRILRNPLPILEVPVASVRNEKRTPFAIFVYLAWKHGQPGLSKRQKLLVGNFAVFPPDRPGRYTLRVSNAFRELSKNRKNLERLQLDLQLEIRRVHENRPWTSVEATIGPVRWLREEDAGKDSP